MGGVGVCNSLAALLPACTQTSYISAALLSALLILSKDMTDQIDIQVALLCSKIGQKASLNRLFQYKRNSRGKAGITAYPHITLDRRICNIWTENGKAVKMHPNVSS